MKEYIATIPRGVEVNIFDIPEDFDEIVKKTFREYTEGTAKDYRYVDKLGYIDTCIERFGKHYGAYIDDIIDEKVKDLMNYHWDTSRELISESDIYNIDFMVSCYEDGKRNTKLSQHFGLDDHHIYEELQKLLVRIITIIMNYEF